MPYPPWGLRESDAYASKVRRHAMRGYGWTRDQPDHRDVQFTPVAAAGESVDLEAGCPPVYDQGPLASCSSNAVAAAVQFLRMKVGSPFAGEVPSRLFIYFGARVITGTVDVDSGGSLRDCIKVVATDGACTEDESRANAWPYVVSRFSDRPPRGCFRAAIKGEVRNYHRIAQDVGHMEACLADGYPFVFGFSTFAAIESKEVRESGHLPMPSSDEQPIGGHAALVVGYDRGDRKFKVRNSWGKDWGKLYGYFWIPYEYIESPHYAADFWTIRSG